MALPITSLPLPKATTKHLAAQNITFLSDVVQTLPWLDSYSQKDVVSQLEELNLPQSHEKLLLDVLTTNINDPSFLSSKDVKESVLKSSLITFSSHLDALLCGGIFPGEIIEFVGEPGSGTTQLCSQLAVDCTIPKIFGGRNCKTLIVDCNGDTCEARLNQMADATLSHLKLIASSSEERDVVSRLTVKEMLSSISTMRCTDYSQLLALINNISEECNYGAVIVDALATHFRHEFDDMRQRTNILAELSNKIVYPAQCNPGDSEPSKDGRRGKCTALSWGVVVSHRTSQSVPAQSGWRRLLCHCNERRKKWRDC
ncbi:DNA repair protein RAD51 homolog 3-like isoform X2 [Bolinopsis microptera]|uniref:DNA repair protein RAD51 homolog 3-like isoform X2 n=1 Tax=Bolinopsis microptera TaxID=2820187 RepID=UPI0030796033